MTDESKPLSRMNVFISGPMSDDPHNHVNEFLDAHRRLNELGAAHVYDPAAHWVHDIDHGCHKDKGHEYYMRRCINELTRDGYSQCEGPDWRDVEFPPLYDLLVQLDGWEESEGATNEYMVAKCCGIEFVEMKSLDSWIEERKGK